MYSYYGLVSKKVIESPVLTSNDVCLPYYPGFLYVAYEPEDSDDVGFLFSKYQFDAMMLQVTSFTFYPSRPEFLSNHVCTFEVQQQKVLNSIPRIQIQLLFLG